MVGLVPVKNDNKQPEDIVACIARSVKMSEGDIVSIKELRNVQLKALKNKLSDAVANKKRVYININSKEPEEILKGTYVAGTLSKQGYSCNAKILRNKDEIDWTCEPSE